MYRAKIDEWRFFRSGFELIHLSLVEKGVDIRERMPLPFDYEYGQAEQDHGMDLIAEYNKLKETGVLDV